MIKPLHNRAVVKPDEAETETASGIILTDKSLEKPMTGEVVIGNDLVKCGDRVIFSRYGYDETKIDGIAHYIVSDFSILAVLE